MGLLVEGKWQDKWYETDKTDGRFVRWSSPHRNWVTPDGSPGSTGKGGFKAEAGRYHLYVSYACPWAHRTLIFRSLKGLERMIDVSVVHWLMLEHGWTFEHDRDGIVGDKLFNSDYLYQVYLRDNPGFSGRVTVPILWDKKTDSIVSNESSEIIRMLNSAFDEIGAKPGDFYPEHLRAEIDAINERIYHTVNNGVYKSGFGTTQSAYEEAVIALFETLDWLDELLSTRRFLIGDKPTEADWRLLPTLLRFDSIYHGHFKCNMRRLIDYPNLWPYTRDLYSWPGISQTVHLKHAKDHYYQSHPNVNPTGVVPIGPDLGFSADHGRAGMTNSKKI